MHVKKSLMLWAVVFALALPLLFVGTAGAAYLPDGATQDATSGGWDLPQDLGVCVTGIQADGTLNIDSTVLSRPDCLIKTFPTYTTQAACSSTSNNESAAHFWASTCVANDGTPINLKGLDRNNAMCIQAAAALGKTATGMANACTSAWQYAGRDATYSGGAYASGGFDQGFCYAAVDVTATYGTKAACIGANSATTPMLNAWNSTLNACVYSYGVGGGLNGKISSNAWAAVKDMTNGTTTGAHAALPADMTVYNNFGKCTLAGFTWNNYAISGGTDATIFTASSATVAINVVAGNWDCLRCHNSVSQNNSVAERWKESYLLQGHKNMLRAVTAGKAWGGPDANGNMAIYTASAAGALDFTNALASTSTGTWPLLYIFGDWMAVAPGGLDVVVNTSTGMKYNGTSQYSCTPCHTTGYYQPSLGLCSKSSLTTSAGCTGGGGIWYPQVGFQGALSNGQEPQATFPTVTNNYGNWDLNGIQCARCHMVTFPEVYDSTYSAAGGNGHDFGAAIGTGTAITNMCFGCHQSTNKTSLGTGADVDLNNPTMPGLSVTATTADFSGHPIGEEFLNSPHSRYTGTMVPNALGKYDIGTFTGGAFVANGTFNTAFNDGFCSGQSTKSDGSEIKTQADCLASSGTWTYRTDQGSCTSCHDIHNSMFVASEAEKAMKKECADCHSAGSTANKTQAPAVDLSVMSHPQTTNTPFDTNRFGNPCETCHMPKATASGFPIHLWRINTSASYTTFPTYAQFSGNTQKTANVATDDAGYTNAIWVDVDLACGQCHEATGLNYVSGNPLLTKDQLAVVAAGIHTGDASVTSSDCVKCHVDKATADGTTHHAVGSTPCLTCHTARLHSGILPANGQINPTYSGGVDTPGTGCLACHGPGGLAAASNIIPDGTNDNHHSDHGTCTQCHGAFGGQAPNNAGTSGQYGGARKYLATDGGAFCLTCHGNTGSYGKHHAVQAVVDAGMNCLTCHAGDAGVPGQAPPVTNASCLFCHNQSYTSTTGKPIRAVIQGTNHHNGTCTTCHTAEPFANLMHTSGTTTITAINTITDSDASVMTACLSCHGTTQTRSSDSSTLAAITPKVPDYGPVDNHHRGHGGNDTDPVGYRCLGCHGSALATSGTPTVYTITSSGLTPTVVSAMKGYTNGADATSSLCLACHSVIQSGQTYTTAAPNHHAGACLNCHVPDQDGGPGITSKTTGTTVVSWKPADIPSWVDCSACHGATPKTGTIQVIQGTNHHSGVCSECHTSPGVPAMPAPDYTITLDTKTPANRVISNTIQTSCLTCHSTPKLRSSNSTTIVAIVPSGANDNHHNGHAYINKVGSTDPGLYCLGCHGAAADNGTTYKITAAGLPTSVVSAMKSMVSNTEAGNEDATSTLCVQCHSNVDTGHGSIKQYGPNQNHHNGKCVSCHRANGSWSGAIPAGVSSGSNVIISLVSNSRDNVTTVCVGCHANPETRSSDSSTIRAIVPTGTGDNHHRGSGTTTARTVAGCLYCHGSLGGLPFGSAGAQNMVQQSPSAPYSCNGSCHSDVLPTSGKHHTGTNSQGSSITLTKNTLCLTCHNPADATAFQPGVGTEPANWTDCTACHTGQTVGGVATGPSTTHHLGTSCETCHVNAGQKPATAGSNCQGCHGESVPTYMTGITTCQNCHTQGGALPTAAFCQGCHNGTIASTWSDDKMAKVHNAIPTAAFTAASDLKTNFKVNYTVGTITCPSGPGTCTYGWDFGDLTSSNSGTTKTTSHTFASAGTYTTTLTVTSGNLNGTKSVSHPVKAIYVAPPSPIVITLAPKSTATGFTYTIPSLSAIVTGGTGTVTVKINWGDGTPIQTVTRGVGSDTFSHVYKNATIGLILPYNFVLGASDSGITINGVTGKFKSIVSKSTKVTVLPYYIAGDVLDSSGTPIAGATVTLKQGTTIRKNATSNAIGQYLFSNVKPELVTGATTSTTPYTISVVKAGYTFTPFTFGAVIDPASTTRIIIKDMTAN